MLKEIANTGFFLWNTWISSLIFWGFWRHNKPWFFMDPHKKRRRPAVPINSMISMPFPTSNAIQCPILLSMNRLAHGIFRCFLLVGFNPTILGQKLVIIPKCYKFTKKLYEKLTRVQFLDCLPLPKQNPIGPSCHSPDADWNIQLTALKSWSLSEFRLGCQGLWTRGKSARWHPQLLRILSFQGGKTEVFLAAYFLPTWIILKKVAPCNEINISKMLILF